MAQAAQLRFVTRPVRPVEAEAGRVLIVDPDRATARMLSGILERAGYLVFTGFNGKAAIDRVLAERPDLVILDLSLRDVSGDEVVRQIRREAATPIVVLGDHSDSDERARLLDLGADDYLTKPVGHQELGARVRAILRRAGRPSVQVSLRPVSLDGLEVDPIRYRATADGRDLQLSPRELRILAHLAANSSIPSSTGELLHVAWPTAYDPDPRGLRWPLKGLRRKLRAAAAGYAIAHLSGVGYRLTPVREAASSTRAADIASA